MSTVALENPEPSAQPAHPKPNYIGIFLTLMLLTVITVVISRIDLGSSGNTAIALAVAFTKGSLVCLYFMHLKYERWFLFTMILIPLLLAVALILGLLPDLVFHS